MICLIFYLCLLLILKLFVSFCYYWILKLYFLLQHLIQYSITYFTQTFIFISLYHYLLHLNIVTWKTVYKSIGLTPFIIRLCLSLHWCGLHWSVTFLLSYQLCFVTFLAIIINPHHTRLYLFPINHHNIMFCLFKDEWSYTYYQYKILPSNLIIYTKYYTCL